MRFLIDEMFPLGTCSRLLERGHDAVHVKDLGLDARPDREVAAAAARENRALVTENVKDFAAEHDIVVACVLKSHLTQHGIDTHLASLQKNRTHGGLHGRRARWACLSRLERPAR